VTPSAPASTSQNDDQTQAGGGTAGQQNEGSGTWLAITIAVLALGALLLSGGVAANRRRPRRRGTLLPLAVVAWGLVLVFAAALISWWLAVLVVVLMLAAAPGLVRERRRLTHRHDVHRGGPAAASSAWSELIAESRDRGIEVGSTETVRTAARRMAREHSLDEGGKRALRTVVSEVERAWYGGRDQPDPTLAPAFDDLMDGIRRNSPLGLKAKILPRSVLRR
jgi:hypothetical protein